jgi:hypothetical protein
VRWESAQRHLKKFFTEEYDFQQEVKSMKYEVKESKERSGEFLAIAVNEASHNEVFSALFCGPDARQRAEEYADWKNSQLEVTGEQLLRR